MILASRLILPHKGLLVSVQVINLGFGEGIVDTDGGDLEFIGLKHLIKAVNTNGGPFTNSLEWEEKQGTSREQD